MSKIKNIGTLDVRKVTKELAEQISEIKNVGTYVTDDNAELLMANVSKKNLGRTVKTAETLDCINQNGKYTLKKATVDGLINKTIFNANGKVIFESSIQPEAIREKFLTGNINGKIIAPKKLSGVLETMFVVNGNSVYYDDDMQYYNGTLRIDEDQLFSYFGEKRIAVQKLIVTDDFDYELFKNNFETIQVLEKLVVTKEHLTFLKPFLKMDGKILLLNDPVYYTEGDIVLSSAFIDRVGQKHLHVAGEIKCEDISLLPEAFTMKADKIICYKKDSNQIKIYCDTDQLIEYFEEQPLMNYSTQAVTKSFLSEFKVKKQYSNYGTLSFDEQLTNDDIETSLLTFINYGTMILDPSIEGVVRSKITENYGTVTSGDACAEECNDDDRYMYKNLDFLAL